MPPTVVPLGKTRAVVVLPPRLVRRVLRKRSPEAQTSFHVPHVHVVACHRDELSAALDGEVLMGGGELPPRLFLIPDEGGQLPSPRFLWRLAFHGAVHEALEAHISSGNLPDAVIRSRIHALGQTEFDEVRFVLRQEELLVSAAHAATYVELAAYYLELSRFEPEALARTFPTLHGREVLALLRKDVDDEALAEETRPAGVEGPCVVTLSAPPSERAILPEKARSETEAASAEAAGNLVRATLYRVSAQGAPEATLGKLTQAVLSGLSDEVDPAQVGETDLALRVLAERGAASLLFESSMEARLLYDLQRAASKDQRDIQTVDLVTFLTSFGKRPLVRTLPTAKDARALVHLRRAVERLPHTSLSPSQRALVVPVLHRLSRAAADRLAMRVRPLITGALEEVGLVPVDARTRAARRKLVEELVDQIVERGFFGIGQLRDALSRNELPVPPLRSPLTLLGDDPLLAADKKLAVAIDGLYRPGEIYLRALQKSSSVAFGTRTGRFLSLYLVLPVLAAFVALEGLSHLVGPLARKLFHVRLHLLTPYSLVGLAAVVFALIHIVSFRRGVLAVLYGIGRAFRAIFVRFPAAVLASRPVRAVLDNPGFRLVKQLVVKPMVLSSLVLLGGRRYGWPQAAIAGLALFGAWNVLLNTRSGRAVEERITDGLRNAVRHLGRHLLPGIAHAILDGFRRLVERLERVLYAVQEYLRFRKGDPRMGLFLKGLAGFVWFFTAYVVRLYVNVLIEPQINPIKHFPVVTVSHKIILPLTPTLLGLFRAPLMPLGPVVANAVAGPTIVLLPGMFGFLVWELKENFRLYRQNRSTFLEPALVGSHGETMRGFLVPGFHSGTVPKLYAKMRRAAFRGDPAAEKHAEALHHVEHAVERFIERELFALLEEDGIIERDAWQVAHVEVAGNRLRARITGREGAFRLAFEEQSGSLLADLRDEGLLSSLDAAARFDFENALFAFYLRAGVRLARQPVEALLGEGLEYDIADEGLVVWKPDSPDEVVYDLETQDERLEPRGPSEQDGSFPVLERSALLLSASPLARVEWERALSVPRGQRPRLVVGPSLLPKA